ncbi:MAG: ribosome recycling factor [Bacteroidia bacterium]
MDDSIQSVLAQAADHMEKSINHLQGELQKIRAGKASPEMIDGVMVEYYGSPMPISQVATVSAADPRTLTITPWERNMIPKIERAIRDANLGFNPGSDGEMVRVPVPSLTEERRKDLVRQAKAEVEHARVAVRQVRNDSNQKLKKLLKDSGVSEDAVKAAEKKIQELTDTTNGKIDIILKEKEAAIMTV